MASYRRSAMINGWRNSINTGRFPQYQQLNKGMSLAEFKQIFWWEWAHRFLARGVGFLVAVPLAFFWLTGRLERRLKPRMIFILALGALQGAVGWWMVASGLVDRVDVSQYRLATHLTLACIIFAAVMYVARGLAVYSEAPANRQIQRFAGWFVLLSSSRFISVRSSPALMPGSPTIPGR